MNLWIEWDPAAGNAKPTKADNQGFDYVTIRRRDGFTFPKRMSMVDWSHQNMPSDVVAYCLDYVPPESVADIARERLEAQLRYIGGCSDEDCKVAVGPGVRTNVGCRCLHDPIKAVQVVAAYRQYVKETT